MRKHYILLGGGYVYASSPGEFVTGLRNTSPNPERDDYTFMLAVAQRCIVQSGAHIRTTSPDDFLSDLIQHGYVFPINLA